jgi:hypothetical protein
MTKWQAFESAVIKMQFADTILALPNHADARLLVWPPLSTTAYSVEKKGEDSMEAASRNGPCVQKVLQVVMQYAGAFAAFVVSRTADLGGKVGRIFSHKSLEEPSNKTPAWCDDCARLSLAGTLDS